MLHAQQQPEIDRERNLRAATGVLGAALRCSQVWFACACARCQRPKMPAVLSSPLSAVPVPKRARLEGPSATGAGQPMPTVHDAECLQLCTGKHAPASRSAAELPGPVQQAAGAQLASVEDGWAAPAAQQARRATSDASVEWLPQLPHSGWHSVVGALPDPRDAAQLTPGGERLLGSAGQRGQRADQEPATAIAGGPVALGSPPCWLADWLRHRCSYCTCTPVAVAGRSDHRPTRPPTRQHPQHVQAAAHLQGSSCGSPLLSGLWGRRPRQASPRRTWQLAVSASPAVCPQQHRVLLQQATGSRMGAEVWSQQAWAAALVLLPLHKQRPSSRASSHQAPPRCQ